MDVAGSDAAVGAPPREDSRKSYDAFISYSHADVVFGQVLQRGLQHLAKPWNRRRAMEVFRDETSLAASPGLWPEIQAALDASRWFVLLASGLSSSSVGTYAGQVVMQGFIGRRVPLFARRAVTMLPALVVLGLSLPVTASLVISQVVLSFGIPFALVPLVLLTRRRDVMGALVNRGATTILASVVAALIIALNVFLLYDQLLG